MVDPAVSGQTAFRLARRLVFACGETVIPVSTKFGIGSDSVMREPCIVGLGNLRPLGRGRSQLAYFLAPATQITAASVTTSIVPLTFSWSSSAAKPSPMKGWSN